MDDLVAEFLTETNEGLGELDSNLVRLEQNPNDQELLSKIFRLMHTIKGTCGFLGLPRLETVAHKAEDVFDLFRTGALEVTPECVTLIFESLDRIKMIIAGLEQTGAEPQGDDSDLIARLQDVLENKNETPKVDLSESVSEAKPQKPQPAAEMEAFQGAESGVSSQSLRVNVEVLENLMTMVSELVLTRNQLLQIMRAGDGSEFTAPLQRLNHVVSDLQEGVMKTRMQPVGNAWSKLPRIVRDISMDLGKKIDLDMRGQDTELDRQVLELIKDPLTHMVRNSADHGIEIPAERTAAGKPETGTIRLNSYHEGGHIIIEIADDGKGLSTEKIRKKALANGLATEDELKAMTTQQVQQFIFKAGFSTAEKVTSVSGRGVGMDVVRTNIEKIGGSIELKSEEGRGTRFIIKIPLTLAIVSALIVESGGERFAIPQLAVRELVMTSSSGDNRIEHIKDTPVFRLRDHLLPLVSLSELLKISGGSKESKSANDRQYIVVTQLGTYSFGIIVDRVFDTEEIVVKPVTKMIRAIDIFSGNTILGDGTVIMILDPVGIAKRTGEMTTADTAASADDHMGAIRERRQEKTALLLFHAGDDSPKAVPLELVSRLEEFKIDDIEKTNGRHVIQYRDRLMAVNFFEDGYEFPKDKERVPALVFADRDSAMALVVDDIVDIAEEHIDIQMTGRDGIVGSAIIRELATDVIDVAYYLQKTGKNWFKNHGDEPFVGKGNGHGHNGNGAARVLLVEDSPFFRNMLSPLLSVAGYKVTAASNAEEALSLCDAGERFDIIISDIEMPEMDGFAFAEKVRADSPWRDVPLVALSSHATPQDMARGKECGFDRYIAKFDREELLSALSQTLFSRHEGVA